MSTTLARRLGKLETSVHEDQHRRLKDAIVRLRDTLAPEHARMIVAALRQRGDRHGHAPGLVCPACIREDSLPAIVRAMVTMLLDHVQTSGAPVALPPEVARVYFDHPDAVPAHPCPDCRYLLPARGGRLAFTGACPGCRTPVGEGGR